MTQRFMGERTLMRIFIGEGDKHRGKPLYEVLLHRLRERGLAGATVLRGVAGFGASSTVHTDKVLRLSIDLPIIVEVVETEEAIESILPELDEMLGGGLITLERTRVIMYRPDNVRASQRELHRIEGIAQVGRKGLLDEVVLAVDVGNHGSATASATPRTVATARSRSKPTKSCWRNTARSCVCNWRCNAFVRSSETSTGLVIGTSNLRLSNIRKLRSSGSKRPADTA